MIIPKIITIVSYSNKKSCTNDKYSPRTLDAMKVLGIEQEQIGPEPPVNCPFDEPEYQEKWTEHYLEKRKVYIQEIYEKRDEIIKNGGDALSLMLAKKNAVNYIIFLKRTIDFESCL